MKRRRSHSRGGPVIAVLAAIALLVAAAVASLEPGATDGDGAEEPGSSSSRGTAGSLPSDYDPVHRQAAGPGVAAGRGQTSGAPSGGQVVPGLVARQLDLSRATDVDLLSTAAGDPDAAECTRRPLLTDLAQDVLFAGLDTIREGTRPMPWEHERELGEQLHVMLTEDPGATYHGKIVDDPELQRYLESLLDLVASHRENPQIEFVLHLVDDSANNAFATIGGFIYVTTGLLSGGSVDSEAQLVAILAHEIGHVDRRHTAYLADALEDFGLSVDAVDLGLAAVVLGRLGTLTYSRELEDESDRYAYARLSHIGYSPFEMEAWFWAMHRRTGRGSGSSSIEAELENLFATHSALDMRACQIRALVRQSPPPERTYLGHRNFELRVPAETQVY